MTALVRSLADIALLRGDPSGLPSSRASVAAFVAAYASADVVIATVGGIQPVLPRTAVDLALTLPFYGLLLAATRRSHRFPQTINAALGVYVLLAPVIVVLLLLRDSARPDASLSLLVTAGFTAFMIWYLLIIGHILRSALDTSLVAGFAIAVAWLVAGVAVSESLFGPLA
ncbi:MAG TPA: hypothetical protein VFR77_00365 [Steroidobacteraceae bacterium]|nr:hypothetical protein [Steroidobacteraceae bacterium]